MYWLRGRGAMVRIYQSFIQATMILAAMSFRGWTSHPNTLVNSIYQLTGIQNRMERSKEAE